MPETVASRYHHELNSTLSVMGADPVMLDEANRYRYEKLSIDEAAVQIAESQAERRAEDRAHSFARGVGWGPFTNAPSKGESWGRR